jgi:AcrR family transcriptional regulator
VARLLAAAVTEFAAHGWAATTMNAIARRADSPIGSLYQFFPDKDSVARALRTRHIHDLQELWCGLDDVARGGEVEAFVQRYVELGLKFVRSHPAFLSLLDAPSSTLPVGPRNQLRTCLQQLLLLLRPNLQPVAAQRHAEVLLNLNKALMSLYATARRSDRRWVAAEFRAAVLGYLQQSLASTPDRA